MPATYAGSTQPARTRSSPAWRIAACLSAATAPSSTRSGVRTRISGPLADDTAGRERVHQGVEHRIIHEVIEGEHHRLRRLLADHIGQPAVDDDQPGLAGDRARRLVHDL